MRILMLNTTFAKSTSHHGVGGAEIALSAISSALASRGHSVGVVTIGQPNAPAAMNQIDGACIFTLPINNIYYPLDGRRHSFARRLVWHLVDDFGLAPKAIGEIACEFRPDVVFSHNLAGLTWRSAALLWERGLPVAQLIHDYYFICLRSTLFRHDKACSVRCLDCLIATANRRRLPVDSICCVSQFQLQKINSAGLFPGARVRRVIYSPVASCRAKSNRPRDRLSFGFLGRIVPEKGIYLLAEAFRRMPRDCELIVGGACPEAVKIKIQQLAERPVTFLGHLEPSHFFSLVDVLVVPSLWDEPFGRVVVEGQTASVPAICSNRGGLPEALGGEQYGWLFDPSSAGNLVRVMQSIYHHQEQIDQKALAGVHRSLSFSTDSMIAQYEEFLQDTIRERKALSGNRSPV
jgi:glycosyltransferase involved in cell wall biosynthesis